jgi:ATP-dependent Clp protease ATP-binding subunit ClpB
MPTIGCAVLHCTALLQIRGSNKVVDQDPEGKYEALSKYARDLTAAARDGKLDPVIGRDDEIRRCIQILSRRTKNNPVLIGEPGGWLGGRWVVWVHSEAGNK